MENFVQNNGANYSDKILALDASTGKLLWERSLPVRGNMAVSKNTLFFGSTRGLFALNAKDGSIKWENTETTIAYPNNSSPTLSEVDKSVIFSNKKGFFVLILRLEKLIGKTVF
ncbi:MAG: PQQ-binding-like beta-propeller repeat protein [Cytophagaceae bacterium]|nr:PQQ-binding-like beta-propeller repeat protein [Cytophagaceae bacterium]